LKPCSGRSGMEPRSPGLRINASMLAELAQVGELLGDAPLKAEIRRLTVTGLT
jgi:hypothetical protein